MSDPNIKAEQQDWLENKIENLSGEEEEKLQEIHSLNYMGTDDDMPDAFESWLSDLSYSELREYLGEE